MINLALHLVLEMMTTFSFCGGWPYPKESTGLEGGIDDRKAGEDLQDHAAPGVQVFQL